MVDLSRHTAFWMASGLFALLAGQAFAADNLQGIELKSTPIETRVILKSTGEIPHHIVAQDSEKIVVDLSSVDPAHSVQTDFSNADNIEQVVLKPLGGDKLRLVIRGENLGSAIVTQHEGRGHSSNNKIFYEKEEPAANAVSKPTPIASAEPGLTLSRVASPNDKNKLNKGAADSSESKGYALTAVEAPKTEASPIAADPTQTTDTAENDKALVPHEDADVDAQGTGAIGASGDRKALVDIRNEEQSTQVEDADSVPDSIWSNVESALTGARRMAQHTGLGLWLRIAGIAGILLTLGLFVQHKLCGANSQNNASEYAYDEPSILAEPKGPGFISRLIDSLKPKRSRGRRQGRVFNQQNAQSPILQQRPLPGRGSKSASRPGDRPLGLSGLGMQNSLPNRPELPQKGLVNRNHAMNQYAQQASPVLPQPPQRDRAQLDYEMKRSAAQKQTIAQTQTRKPYSAAPASAAQPKPAYQNRLAQNYTQSPIAPTRPAAAAPRPNGLTTPKAPINQQPTGLPANNTEVLDFLRSVAELMEKDGKTDLANGVKKGMYRGSL